MTKQRPSYGGDKSNPVQPGNFKEKMVNHVMHECRWWKAQRITDAELAQALYEARSALLEKIANSPGVEHQG